VTEHVEERGVGLDVDATRRAVDGERDHGISPPATRKCGITRDSRRDPIDVSRRAERQPDGGGDVGRRRTVALTPASAGVEKDGPHADRSRAKDVDRVEIADVDRIARLDARALEGHPEDPWIRLLDADDG